MYPHSHKTHQETKLHVNSTEAAPAGRSTGDAHRPQTPFMKEERVIQLKGSVYDIVGANVFSDVQLIGKLGEMEKEIIQLRQQASDNEAAIDDYKQMLLALQKENAMLRRKCGM